MSGLIGDVPCQYRPQPHTQLASHGPQRLIRVLALSMLGLIVGVVPGRGGQSLGGKSCYIGVILRLWGVTGSLIEGLLEFQALVQ